MELSRYKYDDNNKATIEMTPNSKEIIQYTTAVVTLLTGIIMCFLSFFLSGIYAIDGSVLGYFGETLVFCAGIFGVSIYVKNKFTEFRKELEDEIDYRGRRRPMPDSGYETEAGAVRNHAHPEPEICEH